MHAPVKSVFVFDVSCAILMDEQLSNLPRTCAPPLPEFSGAPQ